jgi:uncharacterized protein DUF3568
MKRSTVGILAMALLGFVACRGNDLGSGANNVDRDYSKPAADVWTAAVKAVESVGLKIVSDKHDSMGGELLAQRGTGATVRVNVKSIDEKTSRATVRVDPGDRDLANLIQERITEKAGMGSAKAGLFGGNSVNGTYTADLPTCMAGARRVFSALNVSTTDEESHATWARLDGRMTESAPVRIRMDRVNDSNTKVSFIVGASKTDDNAAFAQKMKDTFEAMIIRPGGGGK